MALNLSFNNPTTEWLSKSGFPFGIWIGIGLIAVVVWIVFSVAIWKDASRLEREGYQLRFVGSLWWFLLTLFFHFPAALLYWAAHRSSLSGILDERPISPMNAEPGPKPKPVEWWKGME